MEIAAAGVALPDLHPGAGDRLPIEIEHAAEDMGDLADCVGRHTGYLHQIVVMIQRQLRRVERPERLLRRRDESGGAGGRRRRQ